MRSFSPALLLMNFVMLGALVACAPKNEEPADSCNGSSCVAANDDVPEQQAHDPSPVRRPGTIYPNPSDAEVLDIDLKNLDPSRLLPQRRLREAMAFLRKNLTRFSNRRNIVLIDYGLPSTSRRFHIVNLSSGQVQSYLVAHGRGSDPDFDGFAQYFSNEPGSKMSSVGFFATAETYGGNHGTSLRLDGLSSTNNLARERAIVIHGAGYVHDGLSPIGRSWGCPALDESVVQSVISRIKDGTLVYAFSSNMP